MDKTTLENRLARFAQQHLLQFWDQLAPTEQQQLSHQIQQIDFQLMRSLVTDDSHQEDWGDLAARANSPTAFRLRGENPFSQEEARAAGEAALGNGRLGVILVAGGQGTRLGFPHPKGMYQLGPLSNRSLFQMHVEQILALSAQYSQRIPLYLMTSPATHDETVAFFEQHNNFGLPSEDFFVFCQGTMPAVDATTGKLLLASKSEVFVNPDGHGGMLAAFEKSGCLADAQRRGIQQLFYLQVDNPIVSICDAVTTGYHLLSKSEITTQVICKTDPEEKVGNVVTVDGKTMIIEYSDLPSTAAQKRAADGSLLLWAGSIAVHVMETDFLVRCAAEASSLPFHRANKKVPFVDELGQLVEPDSPNAIKFERFIFDLLPSAQNAIVVEVDEAEAFAPLKNASGAAKDTPETARAAILAKHTEMMKQSGVAVADGVQVEISPLFANRADLLRQKVTAPINQNQYFGPQD